MAGCWSTRNSAHSTTGSHLTPPPPPLNCPRDTAVCNTDAAWSKDSLGAGLDWIFTTSKVSWTTVPGSKSCHFIASPLLAEALALRETLFSAMDDRLSASGSAPTLFSSLGLSAQRSILWTFLEFSWMLSAYLCILTLSPFASSIGIKTFLRISLLNPLSIL